jgi:hypothetical protein
MGTREFAAVPEVLLSLSLLAGAHGHTSILELKHFRFQMFLHFRHGLLVLLGHKI